METITSTLSSVVESLTPPPKILVILPDSKEPVPHFSEVEAVLKGAECNVTLSSLQGGTVNDAPTTALFEIQHASYDALLSLVAVRGDVNLLDILQKFIDADKFLAMREPFSGLRVLTALKSGTAASSAVLQDSQSAEPETPFVQGRTVVWTDRDLEEAGAVKSERDVVRDEKLLTCRATRVVDMTTALIQALKTS